MKQTFVAAILGALAALTAVSLISPAVAEAQDAARAPRVAVIDMARVSAESLLGKSYQAQLEKLQTEINAEATKKQTELGKLDAALKTLQEELEKQAAVLSPEARDKKQQEIVRKTRERQAFLEDGQTEINRMRERAQQQAQAINQEFQEKVRPLVEAVAKEKGLDIVLDSQVAYMISRDFDVTRDVITKADELEKSKAAAAAPPAQKP